METLSVLKWMFWVGTLSVSSLYLFIYFFSHKLDVVSCGKATVRVQKAICSGFFRNAAKKDPQEGYRTLIDQQVVYIHPSSALFNRQPEWYVCINSDNSSACNFVFFVLLFPSVLCVTCFFIFLQGGIPWTGVDHQRVYARGDNNRPTLAGGVRSSLLQSIRPDSPQQTEETAASRASLQPLRGAQCLANFQSFPQTLEHSYDILTVWWCSLMLLVTHWKHCEQILKPFL